MKRSILAALALSALMFGAAPAPDGHVYVPPTWVKKPEAKDIMAVWPARAWAAGVGGKVVIDCEVEVDGVVDHCTVISEEPADQGFGAAGLALTPQFQMKPPTMDGVPYVGHVRIPLTFTIPGGAASHLSKHAPIDAVAFYPSMLWEAAPTRAEVQAARPQGVGSGRAVLHCSFGNDRTLSGCDVVAEAPEGKGFGRAAFRLHGKFRAAELAGGKPRPHDQVRFAIQFDETAQEQPLSRPEWRLFADPAAVSQAFPAAARAAKFSKGSANLICRATAAGGLADCKIEGESPFGLGFGPAALGLTGLYALNVWGDDGRPVEGRPVRFRIDFAAP